MIMDSIGVLSQVIVVLIGMVSTYIILDFMSRFGRTLYYKKYVYVLAYIIFTLILFGTSTLGNSFISSGNSLIGLTINIGATLIGTIIIGHFLYNNNKIYILYYSIFILFMCCFQIIANIVLPVIYSLCNINFSSTEFVEIASSIIIQFANFSASRLFIMCFRKKKIERITPIQYLNFLILPFFSIFYIITLIIYLQIYASTDELILLVVNIIFIIILNLYITNVFEAISKNNILKNELDLYEQQSKLQYQYYNDLERKYKSSRTIIHDMKNHLQSIEQLYHLQENDMAFKYTKDMYQMLDELGQKYYTSNRVLNIIVNDKVQRAETLGINIKCQIGDIQLEFIRDIDLTTIVANLFDNAIEACRRVENNRYINFKADKFNEFMVMTLSNSIEEVPVKDGNRFISQKKNHEGLGLMNVKKTLEKYEGNMKIQYDKDEFKVNIVIPIV